MKKFVLPLMLLALSYCAMAFSIIRGPYLQSSTDNSIKILWRTDSAGTCVVHYGDAPGNLTNTAVADTAAGINHALMISGLQPKTKYYYSIEFNSTVLAGANDQHHFITNPVPGDTSEFNIWVTGDFGNGSNNQIAVKKWFHNYIKTHTVTSWIWLGDNVYSDGKDNEYRDKVFDNVYGYDSIFRFLPFYPMPGNHDYNSVSRNNDPTKDKGPYFNMVDVPKNGEAGGLASGTETFYSFDYGNLHFESLNSEPIPYTLGGDQTMKNYIRNDLDATSRKFKIAYWHQPPYSKGSHDSDDGFELIMKSMREDYLPILEPHGIDLVLNGHSHVYERSYLIQKHYGSSTVFNHQTMLVDSSSGNPDLDSAYVKYTYGPNKNKGTVYAVVGNSGQSEPDNGKSMPCMLRKLANSESGSMILTVKGNTMTCTYYKSDGTVFDKFAIVKKDTAISTGIKTISNIESIRVYPNPFKKEFSVELIMKKNDQLKISITSIDGKSQYLNVWTGNVTAGKTQLNLTENVKSLPAGSYLLHFENNEGSMAEKIVKL